MGATTPSVNTINLVENHAQHEMYHTARPLLLRDLADPKYRYWIKQFAGEVAAPCVAESLMSFLRKHPLIT
ncbi:hypothetical protein [Pseudomonas amygdali]|uniref:Uncharacterized protein n=1 Tax=Pseudomonas amygdali pv. photiniae TaxID=251724 RepID=A0A0P9U9U9_PSEA0|nr:hypothetical protein [Pseudomonas amygdali]KPX67609.1 Uncharacterized protein ALO53_02155 [Pseudomonas amygdali pv. photiniae]